METSSLAFAMVLNDLITAIEKKDSAAILRCYDLAKGFDLEKVNSRMFKQYERLIDMGNKIVLK